MQQISFRNLLSAADTMKWATFLLKFYRFVDNLLTMDSIGQVLRRLREAKDWSLDEVAPRLGYSASALASRERGETRVKISELPRFAEIFGVSVGQIMSSAQGSFVPIQSGIPLINVTQAGNVLDYTEWGTTSQDAPTYIDRDQDTQSDRLFALKIVGNSMSPTIEEGDICVFRSIDQEHDEPPASGSIVYVHLGNDAKHVGGCCGRFYPLDDGTYRIRKDNPAHKAFDVNAEHVDQLAVCIQRRSVPR